MSLLRRGPWCSPVANLLAVLSMISGIAAALEYMTGTWAYNINFGECM